MKELKIGDKVRIRKDLKAGKTYGGVLVVPEMLKYCGKRATIKNKPFSSGFWLNEFPYFWSPKMFELDEKLIFRDDATILIKDGKKYVTKCDKNDTYDREKGLLVVLAKANGYNYNDIQEMLKNAEIQNKKVREVKRVAKVGEYVKIVNAEKSDKKIETNSLNGFEKLRHENQQLKEDCAIYKSSINELYKAQKQLAIDELEKIKKFLIEKIAEKQACFDSGCYNDFADGVKTICEILVWEIDKRVKILEEL